MNNLRLKPLFFITALAMLSALPISAQAGCMNTSSATAKALAKADQKARSEMALENAKNEVALKLPKSPYGGCIAATIIDWGKFANILSMDAIIKMIRDRMQAVLDQACNAVRNVTAMPGRIVNGTIQSGVNQINGVIGGAASQVTSPVNTVVDGAYNGINGLGGAASGVLNGAIGGVAGTANGAINGAAGGANRGAGKIVNGIIP